MMEFESQERQEKLESLPSLGLSLGSVLGGMADAGGPYCEDGLIWGSYLFSTGLTFSTDSTLQYVDTNNTVYHKNYDSAAGVTKKKLRNFIHPLLLA